MVDKALCKVLGKVVVISPSGEVFVVEEEA